MIPTPPRDEALSGDRVVVPREVLKAHDEVCGDPRIVWLSNAEAVKEGLALLPALERRRCENYNIRPEADDLYTIISIIRALINTTGGKSNE